MSDEYEPGKKSLPERAPEDASTVEVGSEELRNIASPPSSSWTRVTANRSFRALGEGDYAIGEELGRGGMGYVVLARDKQLDRPVAIKRLLESNPLREARFVREMMITARLQHPNIVPVYEVGRWNDGSLVYTMRQYDGRNLADCFHKASLEERLDHLGSLTTAAEALAYAHQVGVIHRDVKPSNIVVGDFGETIVIDWGLAKLLGDPELDEPAAGSSDDGLTSVGQKLGTPRFMSPEQARGEAVDASTDVYALGASLYQLLTGAPPFADHANDAVPIDRAPPLASTLEPRAPAELVAICRAALATDPDDRPSAKELATELRRYQTGALVELHRYSSWDLVRRWIKRHKLATAIAAASVIVLALMIARLAIEVRDKEAALERVVAESDRLAIASARTAARHDPLLALETLRSVSDLAPVARQARVIASIAQRNGLPELLATLDGQPDELDLAGGDLIATDGAVAWVIRPSGEVTTRSLGDKPRRIDRTHWSHWSGSTLVVLDVRSGERREARRFEKLPAAASSSRDARVVGAVADGVATIWVEGRSVFEIDDAIDVLVAPDGSRFALVTGPAASPTVSVLILETRERWRSQRIGGGLHDVAFINDTDVLMRSSGGVQILWRADGGVYGGRCDIAPRLASRGEETACTRDGALRISPQLDQARAVGRLEDIELAQERPVIMTASPSGLAYAWHYRGTPAFSLRHASGVRAVALAGDGLTGFSLAADGRVRRWPMPELEATVLDVAQTPIADGRLLPAERIEKRLVPGKLIAVLLAIRQGDQGVLLRQAAGDPRAAELARFDRMITGLAVADDGGLVAVATGSTVHLLDPRGSQSPRSIYRGTTASSITDLEFERGTQRVVLGSEDGTVFYASADHAPSPQLSGPGPVVAVAGARGRLAAAWRGEPRITVRSDGSTRTLPGHGTEIADLDFAADGSALFSAAQTVEVLAWSDDGTSREVGRAATRPSRVRSIRPDTIAALGDAGLTLIDVPTRATREPVTLEVRDVVAGPRGGLWIVNDDAILPNRDDIPHDPDALRAWIDARLDAAR